jgi:hypothetical protein
MVKDPKYLDHGSCNIAVELKKYIHSIEVIPIHEKVNQPQTQEIFELYYRSMKNIVNLNNYYCLKELIKTTDIFVNYQKYDTI